MARQVRLTSQASDGHLNQPRTFSELTTATTRTPYKPAMSPRLSLWSASRGLAIRVASRPSIAQRTPISVRALPVRSYAGEASKPNENPSTPDSNLHVTEEAAQTADIIGETKPDMSQGTPVQEVLSTQDK